MGWALLIIHFWLWFQMREMADCDHWHGAPGPGWHVVCVVTCDTRVMFWRALTCVTRNLCHNKGLTRGWFSVSLITDVWCGHPGTELGWPAGINPDIDPGLTLISDSHLDLATRPPSLPDPLYLTAAPLPGQMWVLIWMMRCLIFSRLLIRSSL